MKDKHAERTRIREENYVYCFFSRWETWWCHSIACISGIEMTFIYSYHQRMLNVVLNYRIFI